MECERTGGDSGWSAAPERRGCTQQIQESPKLSEAHEAIWKRAVQVTSLDPDLGLGP